MHRLRTGIVYRVLSSCGHVSVVSAAAWYAGTSGFIQTQHIFRTTPPERTRAQCDAGSPTPAHTQQLAECRTPALYRASTPPVTHCPAPHYTVRLALPMSSLISLSDYITDLMVRRNHFCARRAPRSLHRDTFAPGTRMPPPCCGMDAWHCATPQRLRRATTTGAHYT